MDRHLTVTARQNAEPTDQTQASKAKTQAVTMTSSTRSLAGQNSNPQKVREVHEFDLDTPKRGLKRPRASIFSSVSSSSTFSYVTAVQQQQEPPQTLDVTPSVISNFVAPRMDASSLRYTTPQASSPSLAPDSESEPGTEHEAESISGPAAMPTQGRLQDATTSQTEAASITGTPAQAGGNDLMSSREQEVLDSEAEQEAAKKAKIQCQVKVLDFVLSSCVKENEELDKKANERKRTGWGEKRG